MNLIENHKELENLFEFLSEDDSKDMKEVKEELLAAGIQPDLLVKEGEELIQKLIGKRKREFTKLRLADMKGKLNSFLQTSKEATANNAKEFLLSLLGNKNSEAFQASFRKIENLSDKEALEILNESKLLEFFSNIMNEEK
ncbi:MAG: hypothetical protein HXY50_06520 [Ignavibacteriaceae bacterium]|nr:hypothetical protein [Ignavibacteriaceae bacterium]